MKFCMFHPVGHALERGWVGRVDGDRVVQLAAQTLQSFFSGGGSAREHAEYPLDEVVLLAPVLHPPSVRVFDDQTSFAFANPAAIVGPGAEIPCYGQSQELAVALRVAVVVGGAPGTGGFTLLAEWRDPTRTPPKDRDFALGLGPVVVTPDELAEVGDFDWAAATALAAAGTHLYPGDVLAGPVREQRDVRAGESVSLQLDGIGALEQRVTG